MPANLRDPWWQRSEARDNDFYIQRLAKRIDTSWISDSSYACGLLHMPKVLRMKAENRPSIAFAIGRVTGRAGSFLAPFFKAISSFFKAISSLVKAIEGRIGAFVALALQLAALACGIHGSGLLRGEDIFLRSAEVELAAGAPWLYAAFLTWILAELIAHWPAPIRWWLGLDRIGKVRQLARVLPLLSGFVGLAAFVEALGAAPKLVLGLALSSLGWFALTAIFLLLVELVYRYFRKRANDLPPASEMGEAVEPPQPEAASAVVAQPAPSWISTSLRRAPLIALATLSSAYVWTNTTGNIFPLPAILAWLASIVLWSLAFMPGKSKVFSWRKSRQGEGRGILRRVNWWVVPVFALIFVVGSHFRLTDLDGMPPQITGGWHLQLETAYKMSQSEAPPLYWHESGGRAPSNMYFLAALTTLPGLRFDFYALKLSVAITSVLSLPVMYWLGKEFIGDRRRKLGIATGLIALGLVAASYWDVTTHRVGYGFGFLTFSGALLGILMMRAARCNRRSDFILAGVTLGLSVWLYAPSKIFPVVVVAATLIAMALRRISWRERRKYCVNLAVSAFVSFMVFLPLFHFALEYPDSYFMRLSWSLDVGRTRQGEEGLPTDEVLLSRFMFNVRKYIEMYHWSGDFDYARGGWGTPVLSASAGGLLALGLAAFLARLLKSRDPVVWICPRNAADHALASPFRP